MSGVGEDTALLTQKYFNYFAASLTSRNPRYKSKIVFLIKLKALSYFPSKVSVWKLVGRKLPLLESYNIIKLEKKNLYQQM